jgi:hypothetical protein
MIAPPIGKTLIPLMPCQEVPILSKILDLILNEDHTN